MLESRSLRTRRAHLPPRISPRGWLLEGGAHYACRVLSAIISSPFSDRPPVCLASRAQQVMTFRVVQEAALYRHPKLSIFPP